MSPTLCKVILFHFMHHLLLSPHFYQITYILLVEFGDIYKLIENLRKPPAKEFEHSRAEPNGFLVHLLAHPDTLSLCTLPVLRRLWSILLTNRRKTSNSTPAYFRLYVVDFSFVLPISSQTHEQCKGVGLDSVCTCYKCMGVVTTLRFSISLPLRIFCLFFLNRPYHFAGYYFHQNTHTFFQHRTLL